MNGVIQYTTETGIKGIRRQVRGLTPDVPYFELKKTLEKRNGRLNEAC